MAGAPEGHRADGVGQIPQAPAQAPQAPERKSAEPEPAGGQVEQPTERTPHAPGFGERGRMRRRARFLRRARELAYRDLGGLVFDLHRFGQRNDQVVLAKLATLGHIDAELRTLEEALRDLRPVTVLREAGIAACPRCAAIHGSDDKFCPGCGFAFDRSADRPLSTAPVTTGTPGTTPAVVATSAPATAVAASVAHAPAAPTGSPVSAGTPTPTAAGAQQADLSIGRPAATTPAEAAPPVRPTAAPVPARPSQSAPSEPAPSRPALSQPSPSQPTPSQKDASPSENGEKEPAPEDEPTQILRPPARGA